MMNCFCSSDRQRYRVQRGFSLVELMVAMVIALLVMAGVVNSFLASKEANRLNDELSYIQENGRYALDMLSRDIRQAGDFGCAATAYGNTENNYVSNGLVTVVKSATTTATQLVEPLYKRTGIEGFDRSSSASLPTLISEKTDIAADALIVRRGDYESRLNVVSHSDGAAEFQVKAKHSLPVGTFMVAADADCRHQAIFQLSGPAAGNSTTVQYGGTGISPGNCSNTIRGDRKSGSVYYMGDCSDKDNWKADRQYPVGEGYNYRPGGILMPVKSSAYYIGLSAQDDSVRSLWVRSLQWGGDVSVPEELADGVVDMRITYGVNISSSVSNTDPPNIVYTTADNIVADEPDTSTIPPSSLLVWNRVVAVRIQLLMRSRTPLLPSPQSHDYSSIFGSDYQNFSDRYIYQVVSTTVAVRNAFRG